MKKMVNVALALCSVFFFTQVQAKVSTAKIYAYQTPVLNQAAFSNANYPTDIVVTNLSCCDAVIYMPSLRYSVVLAPQYVQHLTSYDYDAKRILIWGFNGTKLLDVYAHNHDVLTIYNRSGKTLVE